MLRRGDEQCAQPDRIGPDLHRLLHDRVHRHLLAEVVHGVAVVRQDRVDERLPDVVYIPVHRREHELPLGVALLPLQKLLEVTHRPLHHLGRLEHERQDQLPRAEAVPHLLHGGEENLVQEAHRVLANSGRVELLLDPLLLPVEDHPVYARVGFHPLGRVRPLRAPPRARRAVLLAEMIDEQLQGIGATVEDKILRQRALALRHFGVGRDVRRVDDRRVEPRLHAVVQEHGVEHRACLGLESEAHVRHPEDGEHSRQLAPDQADPFDRLDGRVDPLGIAGREREGERVEQQVLGGEAELAGGDVVNASRDLQLPLARRGHPLLIDRERDHRRAMPLHQRQHVVDPLPSVLHVDGVDDRPAGDVLQRPRDHRRLGGIHHQRRLDAHRQQLDDARHLVRFVAPLGERHADVEHVCARLGLLACHAEDPLVVILQEESLHLARALRVHSLTHQQRGRILVERDRPHGRADARSARLSPRAPSSVLPAYLSHDRIEVLRRRTTAAAHHRHAEAAHELGERGRHGARLERIDGVTGSRVDRQPRVRNTRDRQRGVLGQVADRLAHVLGTGRAVEADHIHGQCLERRQRAGDVGAEQHPPRRVERDLRLHRHAAAEVDEQSLDPCDRRLHLENVLRRLDQQHIHTTFDQRRRLFVVLPAELLEGDRRQRRIITRREHSRRPHGPCHEARLLPGGEAVAGGPRQPRSGNVDVTHLVAEPPLLQASRRALERARLDDVASHGEKGFVDLGDDVRPREDEMVVAPLESRPAEIRCRERVALDACAHGAVVDEDTIGEHVEIAAWFRWCHSLNEKKPGAHGHQAGALAGCLTWPQVAVNRHEIGCLQ